MCLPYSEKFMDHQGRDSIKAPKPRPNSTPANLCFTTSQQDALPQEGYSSHCL